MIRLAGAQIPCGEDIQINKREILKALDWAKENEVDHILTPEGALSGYCTGWQRNIDELMDALSEVELHQKNLGIGLHLGTGFKEEEKYGSIFRNQIRHYDKSGILTGCTNKTFTIEMEGVLPRNPSNESIVTARLNDSISALGLICNDMWGAHMLDKPSIIPMVSYLKERCPDIEVIFHATNGRKMREDDRIHEVYWDWHNSVLAFNSVFTYPILTVDSCSSWHWDGDEEWVDKFPTSSQSGFIDFDGWKTSVPRYGRQYFYYDLESKDESDTI